MKTLFSLVNFVVGLLSLLMGAGNVLFHSNNPTGAVAGWVAILVGATFLWLATQAMLSSPKKTGPPSHGCPRPELPLAPNENQKLVTERGGIGHMANWLT